jgi:hypothetical protein
MRKRNLSTVSGSTPAAVLVGYVLLAAGVFGLGWAESVNPYFEPSVRIQSDRGHQVVTTGPYAYVRHPGYIFGLPMTFGLALALGRSNVRSGSNIFRLNLPVLHACRARQPFKNAAGTLPPFSSLVYGLASGGALQVWW